MQKYRRRTQKRTWQGESGELIANGDRFEILKNSNLAGSINKMLKDISTESYKIEFKTHKTHYINSLHLRN